VKVQHITGDCFHFNRIEATRAAAASPVSYSVFEVPANRYVLVQGFSVKLTSSAIGRAFIAPPGGTVYFGDYIYVGNQTIDFRRDLEAARAGTRSLLGRGASLQLAEPTTTVPGPLMPLCTP
jgi:hypothetical protein